MALGGHIDSVSNGGWLDGSLNLVAGVEILRRINTQYAGKPPITVRLVVGPMRKEPASSKSFWLLGVLVQHPHSGLRRNETSGLSVAISLVISIVPDLMDSSGSLFFSHYRTIEQSAGASPSSAILIQTLAAASPQAPSGRSSVIRCVPGRKSFRTT
jgi:hypothetical protein